MKVWIYDEKRAKQAAVDRTYKDWAGRYGVDLSQVFIEHHESKNAYSANEIALCWPENNLGRTRKDYFWVGTDAFSPCIIKETPLEDFL